MKKITVIIIGAVMMIALCCACSDGSDDGTIERAAIGDISFEIPEGYKLDMEAMEFEGVDEYLVYTADLNNLENAKQFAITCNDISGADWGGAFYDFETSDSMTVSDEELGDVEIVYGFLGNDAVIENPNERIDYSTEADTTIIIDDKAYGLSISRAYMTTIERDKNKESDFEFEINTLKTVIQSIKKETDND